MTKTTALLKKVRPAAKKGPPTVREKFSSDFDWSFKYDLGGNCCVYVAAEFSGGHREQNYMEHPLKPEQWAALMIHKAEDQIFNSEELLICSGTIEQFEAKNHFSQKKFVAFLKKHLGAKASLVKNNQHFIYTIFIPEGGERKLKKLLKPWENVEGGVYEAFFEGYAQHGYNSYNEW